MAGQLARGVHDATVAPPQTPGSRPRGRRVLPVDLAPAQSLGVGFAVITLLGAALLALPQAAQGETPVPFLDALFTASSAITTTGLVTVDTGGAYSTFGEIIVLLNVPGRRAGLHAVHRLLRPPARHAALAADRAAGARNARRGDAGNAEGVRAVCPHLHRSL